MDALGYYPSSWDRIPLALSGLVVILLALVSLALIALRRDTLVARPQALAGGLCMALVWALACGNAFLYAQSLTGGPSFFLAPIDIRAGLFYAPSQPLAARIVPRTTGNSVLRRGLR